MHWPEAASSAQSRPSPPFEFGSGAPKMTAVCPLTPPTMAPLEAMPGPEGCDPAPVWILNGSVGVPQASGGLGGVDGGYSPRTCPCLAADAYTASKWPSNDP